MSDELTELPEGWLWVKTGDICEGVVPGRTKPKDFNGTIPWITLPDIKGLYVSQSQSNLAVTVEASEEVGMKVMPKGTVLMSCVGQFGIVCIAENDIVPNQQFHGFVCLDKVVPEYVAYALTTQVDQMSQLASATTIAYINKTKCNSIQIPLAPLNEQKRIVAKIEELNDRHQRAKQALEAIPELCDRFRQSVLAAAFRGDLTVDWREENPDVEPASVLLERIRGDRRLTWELTELGKMKDIGKVPEGNKWKTKYKEPISPKTSELPNLPSGWEWATLDEIMKKIVDGTHHTPTYTQSGVAFLSVKDIKNETIYFDDCKYISQEEHEELCKRCYPELGDLLITKSGTIGRCAVVKTNRPFSLFVSVALLKPVSHEVLTPFISLAFQAWLQTINIQNDVTGSAIKNFHIIDFRELALPIPPFEEQKEIVKQIRNLLETGNRVKQEYEDTKSYLDRLNQSILAKAFRGELVEQDPNDEPASVLLERIRAEREKLQGNKKSGSVRGKRKKATDDQLDLPGMN